MQYVKLIKNKLKFEIIKTLFILFFVFFLLLLLLNNFLNDNNNIKKGVL